MNRNECIPSQKASFQGVPNHGVDGMIQTEFYWIGSCCVLSRETDLVDDLRKFLSLYVKNTVIRISTKHDSASPSTRIGWIWGAAPKTI